MLLFLLVNILVGIVSLLLLRRYLQGSICKSTVLLTGKTVVITGCNTGIGRETALDLARRGAKIIMACRNLAETEAVAQEIMILKCPRPSIYKLDLSDLESVRKCAIAILKNEDNVDILINNAGVCLCPYMRTKDGFEMQFGTNHLGHFLLTNMLLPKLKESSQGRVIIVSSITHSAGSIDLSDINWERKPYSSASAYAQSKLANILFQQELTKRLRGTNVSTYSLHPGVVNSDIARHVGAKFGPLKPLIKPIMYFFSKDVEAGAQTTIYCAVNEELGKVSGKYYSDCTETEPDSKALDNEVAKRLWEMSEKLVNFKT